MVVARLSLTAIGKPRPNARRNVWPPRNARPRPPSRPRRQAVRKFSALLVLALLVLERLVLVWVVLVWLVLVWLVLVWVVPVNHPMVIWARCHSPTF